MILSLIAGIGKNNELGKENKLLWHLSADLKHFKEITSGHTVIMGRKTFESLPNGPLPNRRNIVITRDTKYKAEGIEIVHSLPEAIGLFKKSEDEIFIIGGAEIYKQAMEYADKLYITHVEAEDKDADAFFPEIIPIVFGEESREEHKKDEKNPHDYSFVEYKKF
jgi:dihydrofolate reductase